MLTGSICAAGPQPADSYRPLANAKRHKKDDIGDAGLIPRTRFDFCSPIYIEQPQYCSSSADGFNVPQSSR